MNKRNPLIFYKFGALMEKIAKQIIKFTDKYKHSNWKKLSNKQLSNLLEESCDLQARLWGGVIFYGYYFYFNDIFMERFIKELEKLKKSDEKLIEYITSPEEISMIGKEKTELLKLAKKHLQTKNKLNKELEEHWQKYRFLNRYYFWGEGYSVKDIKNRFKEIVKKEKEHIDEELEKMKPLKINLKDYNLNKYQQGIIKSARKVSLIMNLADESVNYHFHYMNELYREIARRFQISYEQLVSMRREEIKKSLADNRLAIPKKELTLRLKEHALLYGHNAPSVLTGKELEKYKKKEIKEEETDINEIKGTSVSKKKEKITGKVRIIMEIEDGRDFKEREIIVTPMTNPALVPIMEKAAAIVTDEGGLLSHAAIVSRELGTPCIVGTKNATRAFKNGDIVEVDADKGIVRKIT
ncbi:MAG: hypothetical protein ISS25_02595 [Nanoarchaeota archaeon]|nr:hypothetical protein [DPANN group archaeon]MBL7116692.1 hypothetical protein [Nanoarchaeota archaeon]